MSLLGRKYPLDEKGFSWVDSAVYAVLVMLILFFLQPFGMGQLSGNRFIISMLFGAVTFICCIFFGTLVTRPLKKKISTWKVWHQLLAVFGMLMLISACNFILGIFIFRTPVTTASFMKFIYFTLAVGLVVTPVSVIVDYQHYLRNRLDNMLEKTTDEQKGVYVVIRDNRIRSKDLRIPINDLLYLEARKNDVAVFYVREGVLQSDEVLSTLSTVLSDLSSYRNIIQVHRSFAVNVNNITKAWGNSNGYTLILGDGLATVRVSRSYVPRLKSFLS